MSGENRKTAPFSKKGWGEYPIKTINADNEIRIVGIYRIDISHGRERGDHIFLYKSGILWDSILDDTGKDTIYCYVSGGFGKEPLTLNAKLLFAKYLDENGVYNEIPIGYVVRKQGNLTGIVLKKNWNMVKAFSCVPESFIMFCIMKRNVFKKRLRR